MAKKKNVRKESDIQIQPTKADQTVEFTACIASLTFWRTDSQPMYAAGWDSLMVDVARILKKRGIESMGKIEPTGSAEDLAQAEEDHALLLKAQAANAEAALFKVSSSVFSASFEDLTLEAQKNSMSLLLGKAKQFMNSYPEKFEVIKTLLSSAGSVSFGSEFRSVAYAELESKLIAHHDSMSIEPEGE